MAVIMTLGGFQKRTWKAPWGRPIGHALLHYFPHAVLSPFEGRPKSLEQA
jgi:hypothetical protein